MTEQEIHDLCEKYRIKNYTINDDMSIDVNGSVNLSHKRLTELPLKFNHISWDFHCGYNQLTSLKGSPKYVGGSFDCYSNRLTDLKGGPESVGVDFNCHHNQLTSLEGCPESVGRTVNCVRNKITDLTGFDTHFGGKFNCSINPIGSIFDKVDYDFVNMFKKLRVVKGNLISLKRLKHIMSMFDKRVLLEEIEKYYTIIG